MKGVTILFVCIYALSAEGAPTFSETFNATVSANLCACAITFLYANTHHGILNFFSIQLLVQYVGGTASGKHPSVDITIIIVPLHLQVNL